MGNSSRKLFPVLQKDGEGTIWPVYSTSNINSASRAVFPRVMVAERPIVNKVYSEGGLSKTSGILHAKKGANQEEPSNQQIRKE